MEELTLKDIKKAMKLVKKYNAKHISNLYMSENRAKKIIQIANERGIDTKGEDGNDYLYGFKIVTRIDLNDNT